MRSIKKPLILPADVIFYRVGNDRWVGSNVFTRDHLGINSVGFAVLDYLAGRNDKSAISEYITVWDVQRFTNAAGLLADPTRLIRDVSDWGQPKVYTLDGFAELCVRKNILIENPAEYRNRFQKKRNLLDDEHFGNFHQQLGYHLMISERILPSEWWPKQKFSEDFSSVLPGPYRSIEEAYLDNYINTRLDRTWRVLDLGCGTGYFTRKIASAGCDVVGMDPNPNYIKIARSGAKTTAKFETVQLGDVDALDSIREESIDAVFVSDAMLFYFVPAFGEKVGSIDDFMWSVHKVLKKGGKFINIESHFQFWLTPWFGDVDRPFTVVTEHLSRKFLVTPTYSSYFQAICKSGFALKWMDEVTPDPSLKYVSERAYHFSKEFPLWQVCEFIKL